ncbi:MAG: Ig-like domain-containing protein [bacterium]|nr:Ig-like domain-containing protein [bacterium]
MSFLKFFLVSLIVFIFVFGYIFATRSLASEEKNPNPVSLVITPDKSIGAGEQYEVKATVKLKNNKPCQDCPVSWSFEEPEPGDELIPYSQTTDEKGEAKVLTVSFVANRKLKVLITLPEDPVSNEVILPYKDESYLAFMKLIGSFLKKGYSLPPFGNLLAKAKEQVFKGANSREILLEWNRPFGARRFEVVVRHVDDKTSQPRVTKTYLAKSTTETNASIEVPAFENLLIEVRACTKADSCVDSPKMSIPKMANSAKLKPTPQPIPSFGLPGSPETYQKSLKGEQNLIQRFLEPIKGWIQDIYSSLK